MACCLLSVVCCLFFSGCRGWTKNTLVDVDRHIRPKYELPPPPEVTILRAGGVHWEPEAPPQPGTLAGDFASTLVLFDKGKYYEAERWFHHLYYLAERQANLEMMEHCLFWEAECLFAQGYYPDARDLYAKLLKFSPNSQHRAKAIARQQFIIAHWLTDVNADIQADSENKFRVPRLFNFEKEKPFFDLEGYTVKACEDVFFQDIYGPEAARALATAAYIRYAREKYADADHYYSMLTQFHPNQKEASRAITLGIQSKIQQVGGPAYDTRKLGEARELIDRALTMPDMKDKEPLLRETKVAINEIQAEKDFKAAELYRRSGHPGAAYFQYEIVRRRYPGSEWERKAARRMEEIREQAEKIKF